MTIVETTDYISDLVATVDQSAPWLAGLPESVVTWRPAPSAWSTKEIIGHLIDSAANNHQRFVRAAQQDDLVFAGYEQDYWVRVQGYASAPWDEIVALWRAYNGHLARVMVAVPPDVRYRQHARHNMHILGWQPYAADRPASLDDLMRDYVLHLQHHLAQDRGRVLDAETAARSG
jgi:hypothetical protein